VVVVGRGQSYHLVEETTHAELVCLVGYLGENGPELCLTNVSQTKQCLTNHGLRDR